MFVFEWSRVHTSAGRTGMKTEAYLSPSKKIPGLTPKIGQGHFSTSFPIHVSLIITGCHIKELFRASFINTY